MHHQPGTRLRAIQQVGGGVVFASGAELALGAQAKPRVCEGDGHEVIDRIAFLPVDDGRGWLLG